MSIITVIFPILAMALFGYLIAHFNILRGRDIEGISRFVFNIAIPVLLFNSLAHVELPGHINWQFMLSYYSVALLIFGLGLWASQRWFAHSPQEQGVFGLGASYSNLILVGLPIISAGLGEEALLPLFMLVSVHSAILFFIVTLLVERGNGQGHSARQIATQTGKNLARNPIILSKRHPGHF